MSAGKWAVIEPTLNVWRNAHRGLDVARHVVETARRGGCTGLDPVGEAQRELALWEQRAAVADVALCVAIDLVRKK